MRRFRDFRLVGYLLMAGCLVAAGWRVLTLDAGDSADGKVHLRLTHDMLHASVRAAFIEAIADYRRLRPGVVIDVIEVPSRVFRAWRKTRLVGGMPPDIMRLGDGLTDEELARYFTPLTSFVAQPNPYNLGTPLESVSWKDTFIDGLTNDESFSKALLEYYGLTLHFSTNRLYCNLDLLRRITGSEKLPATLDEFFQLCDAVQRWARIHDPKVVPVAAYYESSVTMLMPLLRQQTQRISLAVNRDRTLSLNKNQAALAWLRGDWAVNRQPLTAGWDLVRQISQNLHPSFIQAQRDDASFTFLQQQSVMIVSGTFDASAFLNNPHFRCGVFRLPPPAAGDTRFGADVINPIQETGVGGGAAAGTFGILRSSPHFAAALDFLHYLTSVSANRKFAARVQRIPGVVGVEITPLLSAFTPQADGWPEGIAPEFQNWGSREIYRTVFVNLHHLISPQGSVQEFEDAVAAAYPTALRRDLAQVLQASIRRSQRTDSALISNQRLADLADPAAANKVSRLFENQAATESELAQLRHALAAHDRASPAPPGLSP